MLDAKVMQLFRTFACIPDANPYRDLAEAEMRAVIAELRKDADPDDDRLNFYAAARANLRYWQMLAAGQQTQTYAGTLPAHRDAPECSLAERLVTAYRNDAAPLLRDDAFVFQAV